MTVSQKVPYWQKVKFQNFIWLHITDWVIEYQCAEEILGPDVQLKIFEKRKELIKEEELQQEYVEETVQEVEVNDSQEEVYDEYSTGSFDEYSEDSYEDAYAGYSEEPAAEASSSNSPPKYKRYRELFYDNAEDGFNKKMEFSADGSMSLILQVIILLVN